VRILAHAISVVALTICVSAQGGRPAGSVPGTAVTTQAAAVAPPVDYVIGVEDVVGVVFWREPDLSADVVVRPDGKISLPLLNEVVALGRTPEQLRGDLVAAAKQFVTDPNVTVVIRQINSRKVFITGNVERPGPYPLTSTTTVLQLIAAAGGLREFAKAKDIRIVRLDKGESTALTFNYEEVAAGRNLRQNVVLRPGDTVLVP